METSAYFQRALFHDRSHEAKVHYEDSADLVFEERCVDTPIEVRVQSCTNDWATEVKEHHDNTDQQVDCYKRKGVTDITEPFEKTKREKSESHENFPASRRLPGTVSAPIVDRDQGSPAPPIYTGRSELDTYQVLPVDLENFIHRTGNDFRVFYLRQRHSHSRLQIQKEVFEQLLDSCNVFPRFTEYVTGLCTKSSDTEVGPPPLRSRPLRSLRDDTHLGFECCYMLRYVELTQRGRGRKPWSLRQFAVYHQYRLAPGSPGSTWILAGVSQCTEALLDRYTQNVPRLTQANPFELHMVFIDKCINNWRPYLAHLTRLVQEQSGKSSGYSLSSDRSKTIITITVEDHQQLKEIEDDVADLRLCLDSTLDTLTSFVRMYEYFDRHRQDRYSQSDAQRGETSETDTMLLALEEKAQEVSYTRKKAESLLSKIRNTRNLVSSLLERQSAHNINQQISALQNLERQGQEENRSMRLLTEKSSRDSSSMRILTIITMIYLPCTIVSNFYSTQFVNQLELDTGGLKLQYAQNTWIFFAISVPLTIFTIFVWFVWVSLSTFLEHHSRWTRTGSNLRSDDAQLTDIEIKPLDRLPR